MSATKSCRTFLPPPTPARPWFAGPGVCRFALAVMLAGLWLGMGTPVLAQPSVCDWAQCPDAEPGPVQNLVVSTTDTADSITAGQPKSRVQTRLGGCRSPVRQP